MYYNLYKIKKGKKKVWINWCNEIMGRLNDTARNTLPEENLIRERCIVVGDYVFFEQTPEEGLEKLFANMKKEINIKHFEIFDQCLTKVGEGRLGYDIQV